MKFLHIWIVVALVVSTVASVLLGIAAVNFMPKYEGRKGYGIGKMLDRTRTESCSLLLSVWFPVLSCDHVHRKHLKRSPYMWKTCGNVSRWLHNTVRTSSKHYEEIPQYVMAGGIIKGCVVFSHGLESAPWAHTALAERLVSEHGLVVVMPHHTTDNFCKRQPLEKRPDCNSEKAFWSVLTDRRADEFNAAVKYVRDKWPELPIVKGGHSLGAATTLRSQAQTGSENVEPIVLLDPWMFPLTDTDRPYLTQDTKTFGSQGFQGNVDNCKSFSNVEERKRILGGTQIVTPRHSGHLHYTDVPFMASGLYKCKFRADATDVLDQVSSAFSDAIYSQN